MNQDAYIKQLENTIKSPKNQISWLSSHGWLPGLLKGKRPNKVWLLGTPY